MTHPVRLSPPFATAFLLLSACLLAGCGKPPKEEEKPPPAPVKWEEPRNVVLEEWTELVGTTQQLPDRIARITAPVEGRVLSVLQDAAGKAVVEGQQVEAGQVLVRLDDINVRIQREKAVAAKKVLLAEKEIADLAVKLAELDVKRLQELKRQQGTQGGGVQLVSQIELDKAILALDTAQAHVRADDRKLEAAQDDIVALDRQLKLYTLTSPRKGRLGRLQVVVGQTLAIGAVVADVVDIEDEIDVLSFVPTAVVRQLRMDQPAHVGSLQKDPTAETGADPEGKVVYIADQAEAETGHFAVKVRFPNRQLKLRANSVARLRIQTTPGRACWCVPEAALMEDQAPPTVLVVEDVQDRKNDEGKEEKVGKARRLNAVIGIRDRAAKFVEIVRLEDPEKKWRGTFNDQTKIVVEKGQGIQTGDEVRLEEEEEEDMAAGKAEEKP